MTDFISGFFVSLSLIAAIGAQNAFVLRQGIRREHVLAVVLVCALSDAVLISAGVAGFGAVSAQVPWLGMAMRLAGAAFLFVYGALRFRAAWRGGEVLSVDTAPVARGRVVATVLLLTWANPHVYLDTLMLIGSISAQHRAVPFAAGAILASFAFFAALGFGARWLAPVFARPKAWVVLECAVGAIMWAIAVGLLIGA